MNYLWIILKETWRAVSFRPWSIIGSVITVFLAAAIAGAIAVTLLNSYGVIESIRMQTTVDVYLSPDIDSLGRESVRQALASNKDILGIAYISKDMAMFRMRQLFGPEMIRGLGANPLPESYEISLDPEILESNRFQELIDSIGSIPGVDDIGYVPDAAARLNTLFRVINIFGLSLWFLVIIACSYIIASTINVLVARRHATFYIMRLVGARAIFVRTPYLLVGFMISIIGFSMAVIMLNLGINYFSGHIVKIDFLTTLESICFIGGGGVIGLFGSNLALRKYGEL